MRAPYLVLVVALLGADTPPPRTGAITGKVVAVRNGNPIARNHVYVYLEPVPKPRRSDKLPGDGLEREIVQKKTGNKRLFDPRVLVVPIGTTVWFPNLDGRDEHNVFSPTEPGFDLGRYKQDKKGKAQRFKFEDEFDIYCDIHSEMSAKVKVVDSPYIERVVDGKFTFPSVPPGKYKVVAWTPNTKVVRSGIVTVSAGTTAATDRELHLQVKSLSGCHERKDGTPYNATYGSNACPEEY